MRSKMKVIIFFVCLSIFYATSEAASAAQKTYADYKVYGLSGDKEDIKYVVDEMKKLDESLVLSSVKEQILILIEHELVSIFRKLADQRKLATSLIYNDFSEIIENENLSRRRPGNFSWKSYYDVDGIYGFLRNMSETYPDWTETVVAGKSYQNREILGLRINTPNDIDESEEKNNAAMEEKPVVFIESGIHAREWITPATTTYFINQLLTSTNPNITSLRDKFDWHIFPVTNPDGYHYSMVEDRLWRKSRSKTSLECYGVDLNRNWDYNWGKHGVSHNPCSYQNYCGRKAFSEVETATMKEYISSLDNLLAYISFHADGQMLLVPYTDSTAHKDNYNDLVKIGKTSLEYGERVNGEIYRGPATAAEILYKASGGSMDWVRHALGTRLVYTYELRGSMFHWPPSRIHEQGDEVTQMMLGLFTEASKLGYC